MTDIYFYVQFTSSPKQTTNVRHK